MQQVLRYHEITAERKPEFIARGYKGRYFFPHRAVYLPKPLSDQAAIAKRSWGIDEPEALCSVALYASEELIERFPRDLFFDHEVMLHDEHMGRPGLVATAHLYRDGDKLYTDEHQSDLVQRIAARREHKSQVEKRFGSWHHMLLNSILHYAAMEGFTELHVATAQAVLGSHLNREVDPRLFERLYDRDIQLHFNPQRRGRSWVIDVAAHRDKLVELTPASEPLASPERTVCIFHDVASGLPGGRQQTTRLVGQMLEIEQDQGVESTYNLAGCLIDDCFESIRDAGHATGFHSFHHRAYRYHPHPADNEAVLMRAITAVYRRLDYTVRRRLSLSPGRPQAASVIRRSIVNRLRGVLGIKPVMDPLFLCREHQFYVKGYRPTPQDLAAGQNDLHLFERACEWVLKASAQDGAMPLKQNSGLIHVPIASEFSGDALQQPFEQWQGGALELAHAAPFTVLGLHAVNANDWLEHYPAFLQQLKGSAELQTVQQAVDQFYLSRAR